MQMQTTAVHTSISLARSPRCGSSFLHAVAGPAVLGQTKFWRPRASLSRHFWACRELFPRARARMMARLLAGAGAEGRARWSLSATIHLQLQANTALRSQTNDRCLSDRMSTCIFNCQRCGSRTRYAFVWIAVAGVYTDGLNCA
jgi:hypothetical protein